jgi:hypothetical protein
MSLKCAPMLTSSDSNICSELHRIELSHEMVHAAHSELISCLLGGNGRDAILSKFEVLNASLQNCFKIEEIIYEAANLDKEGWHRRGRNSLRSVLDATEMLFICFDLPATELSRAYNDWSMSHLNAFNHQLAALR